MAEYEFEITEPFITATFYYVPARTRAEALEKLLNASREEIDGYAIQGEVTPVRPLTVRDVKRGRRLPDAPADVEIERRP